ncbi:B12-binding domain-containing radical SAM protein [bacterium]|nr:B12-binding domain-containing radical SAM protein [bacterium]
MGPPMGLIGLAAYARANRPGRDDFHLVDERIAPLTPADYERLLADFSPDFVAMSVLTAEAARAGALVRLLKRLAPNTPVAIGGPHASACGVSLLEDMPVDFVVAGEGERAFVRLIDNANGAPVEELAGTSGLSFRHRGEICTTDANRDLIEDLDTLPIPAWDLVDLDTYEISRRMTPVILGRYGVLFTSRGCPYRCTYCHDIFTKKFRAQSPARVVDEIEYLIENHGVNEFEVIDDIFNLKRERVLAICEEIRRRRLVTRFSFPNGVRADRLDEEVLRALASVGTFSMALAVETASPRLQKYIEKHNNLDRVKRTVEIADRLGIFTWGFFMLGFPTETRAEMRKTVRFAARSKFCAALFFQVTPFAGTEMTRRQIPPGALDFVAHMRAAALTGEGPFGDYYWQRSRISNVGPTELGLRMAVANLRFYLGPRRVVRIVRRFSGRRVQLVHGFVNLMAYCLVKYPRNLIAQRDSPAEAA